MIRGLDRAAEKLGLEINNQPPEEQPKNPDNSYQSEMNLEQVPMMYRAQVSGRCSLQFASNNKDLERWREEWVNSRQDNQPRYQHQEPLLGLDGEIYRIKIEFPFRLSSNCGQDSILRPTFGKNGIPLIPGSSIKGLFRRACTLEHKIKYCGDNQQLNPGSLRFHGAYPIGDWAGTKEVSIKRQRQVFKETRYRIVDIIHPQQPRQVEGNGSPKALAMISLYQPSLIFEFSSTDSQVNWNEVTKILLKAIEKGVGGKTSTGYGLGGHLPNESPPIPNYLIQVKFKGIGVSPLLRSDEPEFRPNLFKATLRGHVRRLLGGVCHSKEAIKQAEDRLFGGSESPGVTEIYWESHQEIYNTKSSNATYETQGFLHINAPPIDLRFLESVLKFAYIMGGFGKSWRRVFHQKFYPNYPKLAQGIHIGCHWESLDSDWLDITTPQALKKFLDELYQVCQNRLGSKPPQSMNWKEAWNAKNVVVYSKVVRKSEIVELFHDKIFKEVPAIGGRNQGDKRPKYVSNIWHRMFPINNNQLNNNQYLEIATVFYGNNSLWKHQDEGNQLKRFITSLEKKQLEITWGERPKFDNKY